MNPPSPPASRPSLEKLRQALAQPNNAIRKRALAVIYNESMVEAMGTLEEYIGRETEPDLQGLALKVLQKLKDFRKSSSQVPFERLISLLHAPDPESRILALRGLVNQRSPQIAQAVVDLCSQEESPEAILLISQILKGNPAARNLPLLIRYAENSSEKIRLNAMEGILGIIFGSLFPLVLKSLLDPSTTIKMKAYQLISNISRTNLIDTLNYMFECGVEDQAHLAGRLLPSFLGQDLLPTLEKNALNRDAETVALCKRALILLAQKGNYEATRLLERLNASAHAAANAGQPATGGPGGAGGEIPAQLKEPLAQFPGFLVEPLRRELPPNDPIQLLVRQREIFQRICELVNISFLSAYFAFATRNPFLDRTCFKALQTGFSRLNTVNLLRTIVPALPPPSEEGDLFPLVIAARIQNDFNDNFLEQLTLMGEKLKSIHDALATPIAIEKAATDLLAGLFRNMAPLMQNRLIGKFTDSTGIKVCDFLFQPARPVDPLILSNFALPMNAAWLISKGSTRSLPLEPFYHFVEKTHSIERNEPTEDQFWEFLNRFGILENFLAFLREKQA